VSIIIAFFMGYLFSDRQNQINQNRITQEIHYIDIKSTSQWITIKNMPENIYFRNNGELIQSGSIDLK